MKEKWFWRNERERARVDFFFFIYIGTEFCARWNGTHRLMYFFEGIEEEGKEGDMVDRMMMIYGAKTQKGFLLGMLFVENLMKMRF